MRFDPRCGIVRVVADAGNRRRKGRLETESLACDFGPVLDLSSGGLRTTARRLPKGEFDIRLVGIGQTLTLRGKLSWSRKTGLFRHEIGIQFLNVDDETARALTQIASRNCRRRVV